MFDFYVFPTQEAVATPVRCHRKALCAWNRRIMEAVLSAVESKRIHKGKYCINLDADVNVATLFIECLYLKTVVVPEIFLGPLYDLTERYGFVLIIDN